jgi:polysaccharide export outer membrane protein
MFIIRYKSMKFIRHFFLLLLASLMSVSAWSEQKVFDDRLGPGDLIRVFVYKNTDLSADFRIQETGRVTLPLIGSQKLAGLTPPEAEKHIADALVSGGFLQAPQVSISIVAARKRQAVILGFVSKPGPVPLEYVNTRLSDVLAAAGGVTVGGGDFVTITGQRDGQDFRKEVNIAEIFSRGDSSSDLVIVNGDVVYVQKAQVFYAYGEVQKPGSYRLENKMTVQQALVSAGGLTKRGTESRVRLQRRKVDGSVQELAPNPVDIIQPDDVIFVRESLF